MIGEKTFDIKAENFFAGMSSALFANDNGFASGGNISGTIFPTTLNLTAKPGVLYPAGNTVDRTPASDLTSLLIASSADSNFLGYDRVFISDDAKFYSFDGTTLTLRHTDATASRSYTAGKTSMVTLGFSCFTTSSGTNTGISKWAMSSNTFTDNFFAFSDTIAPHPSVLFENQAFYGDGDLLLRQTDEGSTPTTILDLEDNAIITALGTDPGSGRMLIATSQAINMGDTVNKICKVLLYDGFSNKPIKSVPVDDQITAFYNVGGTVFVFYGNKMGYWNGAGITFLRVLSIPLSSTDLVYPAHVTNIDNTIYVVEQRNILAYGEIQPGKKVFYYAQQNNNGISGSYSLITNVGSKKLALSFATAKFYTFDTSSVSGVQTGGSVFFSNRYDFERLITFNTLIIEFDSLPPTNSNIITALIYGDQGYLNPTNIGTVATGSADNKLIYELPYASLVMRTLQLRLTLATAIGIRRITVTYNQYD